MFNVGISTKLSGLLTTFSFINFTQFNAKYRKLISVGFF